MAVEAGRGYRLRLDVRIEEVVGNVTQYGALTVTENIDISAESFMEVASILGKFHELSEQIKAAQP